MTSESKRRIDKLQKELGTEGEISLQFLARVFRSELASSGGRPALDGMDRRQKIPISDQDWEHLCQIAERLEVNGMHPSPAQVGSLLLRLSLSRVPVK